MRLGFSCSMPRCAGVSTRPAPLGQVRCGLIPTRRRTALRDYASGASVSFLIQRRHVVVFSVQMRKIFPFGVPRGAFADRLASFETKRTRKSPGRALQALGERGLTPLEPAPNRNILRISGRFPTRWPEAGVFVDKLPHLLSTKIRGAVCPRIFIGSVVGGKFWRSVCKMKKTPSRFNQEGRARNC